MKKHFLKTLIVSAACVCMLSVSAFAVSHGGVSINASALNLRSSPDTNSIVYNVAPLGSVAVVADIVNDEWYKVVYQGKVGYMSSEFLSYTETMVGNFGYGEIYGDYVHLRSAPSLGSSVLGTYKNGVQMKVLGVSGDWYKVQYGSSVGYVHSSYFALSSKESPQAVACANSDSSDKGQQIVNTAMAYMGVPYVWGGTSPSGFDCSGLVYYVYKENGCNINRTAATINTNGVSVDKADLQVGDAICFSSSSCAVGHVGIYIGNGQFIHASSTAGSVIISDLSKDYYESHYVGSRHII